LNSVKLEFLCVTIHDCWAASAMGGRNSKNWAQGLRN
jgi:hypothetical protein